MMDEEILQIKKAQLKRKILKSNDSLKKIENLLSENYLINGKIAHLTQLNEIKKTRDKVIKLI